MATGCACVVGGEAIATQVLRPIRGEETMSRAGHGVLVYARSGCENAADDIGFVTGGGRDDKNIAHVPEHSEIGVECADLFLAFIDQQAISDRKSVVLGESMSVGVDLGGSGIIKKKNTHK